MSCHTPQNGSHGLPGDADAIYAEDRDRDQVAD